MADKNVPRLQDVVRAFADGNREAAMQMLAQAADVSLLRDDLAKLSDRDA